MKRGILGVFVFVAAACGMDLHPSRNPPVAAVGVAPNGAAFALEVPEGTAVAEIPAAISVPDVVTAVAPRVVAPEVEVVETCNGVDDNGDGAVDEASSWDLAFCQGQRWGGVCDEYPKVVTCEGDTLSGSDFWEKWCRFVPTDDRFEWPTDAERCDGLDNDCDGITDEGCMPVVVESLFDPDAAHSSTIVIPGEWTTFTFLRVQSQTDKSATIALDQHATQSIFRFCDRDVGLAISARINGADVAFQGAMAFPDEAIAHLDSTLVIPPRGELELVVGCALQSNLRVGTRFRVTTEHLVATLDGQSAYHVPGSIPGLELEVGYRPCSEELCMDAVQIAPENAGELRCVGGEVPMLRLAFTAGDAPTQVTRIEEIVGARWGIFDGSLTTFRVVTEDGVPLYELGQQACGTREASSGQLIYRKAICPVEPIVVPAYGRTYVDLVYRFAHWCEQTNPEDHVVAIVYQAITASDFDTCPVDETNGWSEALSACWQSSREVNVGSGCGTCTGGHP